MCKDSLEDEFPVEITGVQVPRRLSTISAGGFLLFFFLTPHPLVCPQNLAPKQSQESQVLRQQFERRMRTRNTHTYSELDRFIWGPTRGKVTSSAITVEQKPTASARNDPN